MIKRNEAVEAENVNLEYSRDKRNEAVESVNVNLEYPHDEKERGCGIKECKAEIPS